MTADPSPKNARSAIAAATLTTPDLDASVAAWALLDYKPIERGTVDERLAAHWGAPKAAGRPMVLLAPETGDGFVLRMVAGHCPDNYVAHRHSGWLALEMTVADVYKLQDEMRNTPFQLLFPPQQLKLDITDCIHAMQWRGPAGEVLYLTTIGEQVPGLTAPVAECRVDRVFAAVVGCSDMAKLCTYYDQRLCNSVGDPVSVNIRTTASAWDMPLSSEFLLAVGPIASASLMELDELPLGAKPALHDEGDLPPGICIYSFRVPSLQAAGVPPASQTQDLPLAPCFGAPAGMLRGPGGEWIELIEDSGALK